MEVKLQPMLHQPTKKIREPSGKILTQTLSTGQETTPETVKTQTTVDMQAQGTSQDPEVATKAGTMMAGRAEANLNLEDGQNQENTVQEPNLNQDLKQHALDVEEHTIRTLVGQRTKLATIVQGLAILPQHALNQREFSNKLPAPTQWRVILELCGPSIKWTAKSPCSGTQQQARTKGLAQVCLLQVIKQARVRTWNLKIL